MNELRSQFYNIWKRFSLDKIIQFEKRFPYLSAEYVVKHSFGTSLKMYRVTFTICSIITDLNFIFFVYFHCVVFIIFWSKNEKKNQKKHGSSSSVHLMQYKQLQYTS